MSLYDTPLERSSSPFAHNTKKYLSATGEWLEPLTPTILEDGIDLNNLFQKKYLDKYLYADNFITVYNQPKKIEHRIEIPIQPFYLKTYTIVPDSIYGQMLIGCDNDIWIRTSTFGIISDWTMIYANVGFSSVDAGGGVSSSELDDLTIRCGKFNNAGAGWQKFSFPYPFEEPPQVVSCDCSECHVDVKDITTTDFQYRVFKYDGSNKTDQSGTDLIVRWFAMEYGGD